MTFNDYMKRRIALDEAIKSKEEQLAALKEEATKITVSSGSGASGSVSDRVGKTVAKIVDLKSEICDDVDKLITLKTELRQIINAVPYPICRTILERKLILLETNETIAGKIGYSVPHTKRLYKNAKRIFEKMIPNELE